MLVDGKTIETYLSQLRRTFESFLKRSPCYLNFSLTPEYLFICDLRNNTQTTFYLQYNKKETDVITEIKMWLRSNWYPRMVEVKNYKKEPSTEDLKKEMEVKNLSFDEAFSHLSKIKIERTYIIDKIDLKKNRLVIIDFNDFEQYWVYEMKIPVIVFLKKIQDMNEKDRFLFFLKNTKVPSNNNEGEE